MNSQLVCRRKKEKENRGLRQIENFFSYSLANYSDWSGVRVLKTPIAWRKEKQERFSSPFVCSNWSTLIDIYSFLCIVCRLSRSFINLLSMWFSWEDRTKARKRKREKEKEGKNQHNNIIRCLHSRSRVSLSIRKDVWVCLQIILTWLIVFVRLCTGEIKITRQVF